MGYTPESQPSKKLFRTLKWKIIATLEDGDMFPLAHCFLLNPDPLDHVRTNPAGNKYNHEYIIQMISEAVQNWIEIRRRMLEKNLLCTSMSRIASGSQEICLPRSTSTWLEYFTRKIAPWAGRQPSSTRDGTTGNAMCIVCMTGYSCEYNNCVKTYSQRLMRHHREKHLQSCRNLMSKHSPVALEVFGV